MSPHAELIAELERSVAALKAERDSRLGPDEHVDIMGNVVRQTAEQRADALRNFRIFEAYFLGLNIVIALLCWYGLR